MKILICGVGTLGGNLVEHLARTGADELAVLDHDKVQQRNLTNQPYFQHQLGKSKVAALAETVFRIRGQQIETLHKRFSLGNGRCLVKGYDLVVDCFDNHLSRCDLQQSCRQSRVDLLHMGLSQDYGEVIWDGHYRVPPDVARDPCAEPLSRSLALQAVLLFEKARTSRENLCFTAGDLVVTRM